MRTTAKIIVSTSAPLVVALFLIPLVPISTFNAVYRSTSRVGVSQLTEFGNVTDNATTTNATSQGGNASQLAMLSPASPSAPPVPAMDVAGNWRTYEYNQQRTGDDLFENTLSVSNASKLVQDWSRSTHAGVFGSLAVVNDTAYVGDFSGNEWALWATNGTVRWVAQPAGLDGNYSFTNCSYIQPITTIGAVRGIDATATVWKNWVYVPADNNHLYEINAINGSINTSWSVDLSNHTKDSWRSYFPWGSSLIYNGDLYIGTASGCDSPTIEGQLLQVNLSTQSVDHIFNASPGTADGGAIWSTPSLERSTGTVWATSGNCNNQLYGSCTSSSFRWTQAVLGLNATNVCQPQAGSCTTKGYWHLNGSNDVDFGAGATVVALANGTDMVVAENKDGYAYGFYASTLRANGGTVPAWSLDISGTHHGDISPATYDGRVLYLGGLGSTLRNGTVCSNGTIRAVYPSNGTVKWDQCTRGIVNAGLTYADGLVIDGTAWMNEFGGSLEVRSATNGAILNSWNFNQSVTGEPVVFDGRIFFGTGNLSTLCGNSPSTCPPGYVYSYGIPLNANPATPILLPSSQCTASYPIQFNAYGQGGMPFYAYNWTFGDGMWAQGPGPIHNYVFQGNYTVDVIAEDSAADQNSASMNVVATYQAPSSRVIVGCSVSTAVCPQMQCTGPGPLARSFFVDYSGNIGAVSIQWNFGDGSTSTDLSPTHSYADPGLYSVSLTVTDSRGNVGAWSMTVWA